MPVWAAVLLVMAVAVVGCKREEGATIEEVQEEPTEYYGKEVMVFGEVGQIYGDRAFVLESRDLFDEEDVLVLTKTPIATMGAVSLDEDDFIRVTGQVQRLSVPEVEQNIGWDLDAEIETTYQGKPVIVAESISFMTEEARWQEGVGFQGAAGEPGAMVEPGAGDQEIRGGVEQIAIIIATVPPETYAGRQVMLENIPVRAMAGDKAFWVGESPERQLLVVMQPEGREGKVDVNKGDRVTVRGTLHTMPAPAQAMRQWNLPKNMRGNLMEGALYLQAETVQEMQS